MGLVVRAGVRDRGVITDHLEFGRRMLAREDPYAPYLENAVLHPPYPPGFGLLTAPFSLLPERLARFGWAGLQVVCLAVLGWWLVDVTRRLAPELRRWAHWALVLTAILVSRYVLRDTHGGGGNLINLALAIGAVAFAERGKPGWSGVLLGFALATKPTHVLLVPLLWVFGHARAAGISAVMALAFTAMSVAFVGFAPLQRWIEGTLAYASMQDVYAEPALGFPPFTWMNQCLRCAVQRYLGEVPPEFAAQVPGFFAGAGWPAFATAWVSRIGGVALLGVTFAAAWRRRAASIDPAALAALLCVSLLLSPISWKAHHVALAPAAFLLVLRGMSGARWVWVLLVAYIPLCVLGEEIVGKDGKQVQQSLYLVTAGTLAMWGAVLARRAASSPDHGR